MTVSACPTAPWRDQPFCGSYATSPARRLEGVSLLAGLHARLVSRDRDGAGLTALVDAPVGWRVTALADHAIELLVLRGALRVDGHRLGGGGYLARPATDQPLTLAADEEADGTRFLLICADLPNLDARCCSVWDEPWSLVSVGGAATGSAVVHLRQPAPTRDDLVGGAAGALLVAQLAPGWTSEVMEVHDAWEENLLLRGDLLMAEPGRGVVGPGMNVSNPAGHWHGPMASKGGALFVIHCDAPKAITTREEPGASETLRGYLEAAPW